MEMDFDPKVIVYVIAGLIYLISQSKKRNNRPEEQAGRETTRLPEDWEETLRRLTETQQPPPAPPDPPKPPPAHRPVMTNVPKVRDYDEEALNAPPRRDFDEEAIRAPRRRDFDEDAIARKKVRDLQVEAMERSRQQLDEVAPHSRVAMSPLSVFRHEEETAPMELDMSPEQLRHALVYSEILKPRHF